MYADGSKLESTPEYRGMVTPGWLRNIDGLLVRKKLGLHKAVIT